MATEEVVVPVEAPVIEEKGDVSKVKKAKKVTKSKPKSPALHPPYFEPKAAAVKSKAKPKTPTKPAKVAKKAPVA
nr:hypothetical protein [Tanacetum cinerariifolium]